MEFKSILDLREKEDGSDRPREAFYQDLNLDYIIKRICLEWEEDVSRFYYYLPADEACENYRREVFADVKKDGVYESLCGFVERMQLWKEAAEKKEKVRSLLQKELWHIGGAKYYCDAFLTLEKELSGLELGSRGMKEFMGYLRECLKEESFRSLCAAADETLTGFGGIRLILDYRDGRLNVTQGEAAGAYEAFLEESFPIGRQQGDRPDKKAMKSPFDVSVNLSDLEEEVIKIVRKRNPEPFRQAESFCGRYGEYARETLLRFASEIKYYLSYRCFEKRMQENGFLFAAPETSGEREMYARGLYDLALACAGGKGEQKTVVSNDAEYREGESFFVLTGPNQGGKTTFARSLGQLIYFTKMGLDVPAAAANVHYFGALLTHFSVEESVETGRGKLKEELERLKPMMSASARNAFVVINELFTTAANYDACEMGRRVLSHFAQGQCRGIYVTHLRELAEGGGEIVSLRAMLDENGRQSFRIERSEAVESAGAIRLVDKYRLTYGQLKERLV